MYAREYIYIYIYIYKPTGRHARDRCGGRLEVDLQDHRIDLNSKEKATKSSLSLRLRGEECSLCLA
jgi:hypothetical protein